MGSPCPCAQSRASPSAWAASTSHRSLCLGLSPSFVLSSGAEQDQGCLSCEQGWGRDKPKLLCAEMQLQHPWGQGQRAASAICSEVTPPSAQPGPFHPEGGCQQREEILVMPSMAPGDLSWPFPTLPRSPGCAEQLLISLGSCWAPQWIYFFLLSRSQEAPREALGCEGRLLAPVTSDMMEKIAVSAVIRASSALPAREEPAWSRPGEPGITWSCWPWLGVDVWEGTQGSLLGPGGGFEHIFMLDLLLTPPSAREQCSPF